MKLPAFVPSGSQIVGGALSTLATGVLVAFIIGRLPGLRQWMADQWGTQ